MSFAKFAPTSEHDAAANAGEPAGEDLQLALEVSDARPDEEREEAVGDEIDVAGTVNRVKWIAADSSRMIIEIKREDRSRNAYIAVIGPAGLGVPRPGERVRVFGKLQEDPQFGRQIQADAIVPEAPIDARGIVRWISRSQIPGVGPRTGDHLAAFFADTLPQKIADADALREAGIGPKKAKAIAAAWAETLKNPTSLTFAKLVGLGLKPAVSRKLVEVFGSAAVGIVEREPWALADLVEGIGFKKADEIALALGKSPDDPARIRAAVVHALKAAEGEGHCGLSSAELLAAIKNIVALPQERVLTAIKELVVKKRIVYSRMGDKALIQTAELARCEAYVARRLADGIVMGETKGGVLDREHAEALVEGAAGDSDETRVLNAQQLEAVITGLSRRVTAITGGPGVGKTFTCRSLVDALVSAGLPREEIVAVAPTGKAAKLMNEVLDLPSSTIQTALMPNFDDGNFVYGHDEGNPFKEKFIFIDETTMKDLSLFEHFLRAVDFERTCLVWCGDVDQLPSVGAGRVFADMIESGAVPVVRLTELYRSKAGGGIAEAARRINAGEHPGAGEPDGEYQMIAINTRDRAQQAAEIADKVVETVSGMLQASPAAQAGSRGFASLSEIMVLSPMYRGAAGIDNLNARLKQVLNPIDEEDPSSFLVVANRNPEAPDILYSAGDRVIQLKNDKKRGLVNGEIGIVEEIVPEYDRKADTVRGRSMIVNFGSEPPRKAEPAPEIFVVGQDTLLDLAEELEIHYALMDLDDPEAVAEHARLQARYAEAEAQLERISRNDPDPRVRARWATLAAAHNERERRRFEEECARGPRLVTIKTAGDLEQIRPAFCMSIHKAQGSESPCVITVAADEHRIMLRRNLFYTALTRGKRKSIIVGSDRAVEIAAACVEDSRRNTLLKQRLLAEVERLSPGLVARLQARKAGERATEANEPAGRAMALAM